MSRTALVVAIWFALGSLVSTSGCGASPYTGKAEKLKKPRPKKRKDGKETARQTDGEDGSGAEMSEEPCRTNFFAAPHTGRRDVRGARTMARRADTALLAAERKFGPGRDSLVIDAMATLTNALDKDPYGPEPTYKLAVAYALVGKKDCSLRLLERLKLLRDYPATSAEAQRTVQRAVRDPAFMPFEKEARTALGE